MLEALTDKMKSELRRLTEVLAGHDLEEQIARPQNEYGVDPFGFDVDYVEDRPDRRFGAVKLGDVRLIDNMSHAAR